MAILKEQALTLTAAEDIVIVRREVRHMAIELGFSLVDQTKIVTAASELARNTIIYGGGGTARIEAVFEGGRQGIRVTFEDEGPGIADIAQAMKDGFTTGAGLGLGLGGAKRLSNEFEIESHPGQGTRVRFIRWR
jgi:serine/threonine-protein kinase RsbT